MDDPLEIWLTREEAWHEARLAKSRAESLDEIQAALDQLQELLDHPLAKGATLLNSHVHGPGVWSKAYLPAEVVTHAEKLYRRVYVTGRAVQFGAGLCAAESSG